MSSESELMEDENRQAIQNQQRGNSENNSESGRSKSVESDEDSQMSRKQRNCVSLFRKVSPSEKKKKKKNKKGKNIEISEDDLQEENNQQNEVEEGGKKGTQGMKLRTKGKEKLKKFEDEMNLCKKKSLQSKGKKRIHKKSRDGEQNEDYDQIQSIMFEKSRDETIFNAMKDELAKLGEKIDLNLPEGIVEEPLLLEQDRYIIFDKMGTQPLLGEEILKQTSEKKYKYLKLSEQKLREDIEKLKERVRRK